MGEYVDLRGKYMALCKERVDLEKQIYQATYPEEDFPVPEILISHNFHQDAIEVYKKFGYPNDYINEIEERANWDSTRALTIHNKRMKLPSQIIIDETGWRDDTLLHELTHISDYYNYCSRNNYLEINYLEFLKLDYFMCIYLFSEFRAFYRCAMFSKEDLKKRMEFESKTFQRRQQKTIQNQQLEAYYYHSVSFVGFYCAFLDKYTNEDTIKSVMEQSDANMIHVLIKFLYPLRNKTFEELEKYFNLFQNVLDTFISE